MLPAVALPVLTVTSPLSPACPPLLVKTETRPEAPFQVSRFPLPPEPITTSPPATPSARLSPPLMETFPLCLPPSMKRPLSPRRVFFLSPFVGFHVSSALLLDSEKLFS